MNTDEPQLDYHTEDVPNNIDNEYTFVWHALMYILSFQSVQSAAIKMWSISTVPLDYILQQTLRDFHYINWGDLHSEFTYHGSTVTCFKGRKLFNAIIQNLCLVSGGHLIEVYSRWTWYFKENISSDWEATHKMTYFHLDESFGLNKCCTNIGAIFPTDRNSNIMIISNTLDIVPNSCEANHMQTRQRGLLPLVINTTTCWILVNCLIISGYPDISQSR